MRLTRSPRASSRQPMEAAARPFPNEDTTPPVTKMYLADMSATSLFGFSICAWCARLSIAGSGYGGNGLTFLRGFRAVGLEAVDVFVFEDGLGITLLRDYEHG